MTIEQMGNVGDLVGGIAVVISFIALTFQMRQNTHAIRAESGRSAEASWAALDMHMAEVLDWDLWEEATELDSHHKMSAGDLAKFQTVLRCVWHQLTSEFYLYREGVADERVWKRRLRWFRAFVESNSVTKAFFEEEARVLVARWA